MDGRGEYQVKHDLFMLSASIQQSPCIIHKDNKATDRLHVC